MLNRKSNSQESFTKRRPLLAVTDSEESLIISRAKFLGEQLFQDVENCPKERGTRGHASLSSELESSMFRSERSTQKWKKSALEGIAGKYSWKNINYIVLMTYYFKLH